MNVKQLIEHLEWMIESGNADVGCVLCGGKVEKRYHADVSYHPYGSTVAAEEYTEEYDFCPSCKDRDVGSNLTEDLLTFLKSNATAACALHKGHFVSLASAINND